MPPFLVDVHCGNILTPLAPPNVLVPVGDDAASVLLLKVCVAVLVVTSTPSIVTTPAPGLAIVVSGHVQVLLL